MAASGRQALLAVGCWLADLVKILRLGKLFRSTGLALRFYRCGLLKLCHGPMNSDLWTEHQAQL